MKLKRMLGLLLAAVLMMICTAGGAKRFRRE